jgi:hypothetical protein
MRLLIFSFFVILLAGCSANQPLLIDCGNGYHVQPPLACPELGK